MYATEPRPIVRHRARRRRVTSVARPYPLVAAVLVSLASVPMLAAVLAGSASLTTTTSPPRSPMVSDQSQVPVVVPGGGYTTATPSAPSSAGPTAGTADPSPAATPGAPATRTPAATRAPAAETRGVATGGAGSKLRRESARTGGSGSGTNSAPRPPAPSPDSGTAGDRSGAGSSSPTCQPSTSRTTPAPPLPSSVPMPSPTLPHILPSLTREPTPSAASSVTGPLVGGLLGLGGLLGGG